LGISTPPKRAWLPGDEQHAERVPIRVGEATAPMRQDIATVLATARFTPPADASDAEERSGSFQARARQLKRLLERDLSTPLATAARLFFDSFSAVDHGHSMSLAFSAIEAALLDKNARDSVVARLKDAVTYRLGASAESRDEIRKLIEALYDQRSRFVHSGGGNSHARGAIERVAGWVLWKELMDLVPARTG